MLRHPQPFALVLLVALLPFAAALSMPSTESVHDVEVSAASDGEDDLRIGFAPPPLHLDENGDQVEEQRGFFRFRCPQVITGHTFLNDPEDTRLYQACPIRIEDGDNFFGNIQLAVHPENPNHLAFFTLHGHPDEDGPTERSRDGNVGTHTMFTSTSRGAEWQDNPIRWTAPYGESATGTIDAAGNLYVAFHSTRGMARDDANWTSEVIAFKEPTVAYATDDYHSPEFIVMHEYGLKVGRVDMVRIPAYDPSQEDAEFAAEENRSDDRDGGGGQDVDGGGARGDAATDKEPTPERVLMAWNAVVVDDSHYGSVGHRFIDAAWTNTAGGSGWATLAKEERIGPCINASAPVSFRGEAYIACSVAKGYDHRPRARIGEVDIWKIDPWSGKTEWVGFTRINGERPHLAATPRGFMVAVAESYVPEAPLEVRMAMGWYGSQWEPSTADYGPALNRFAGGAPILDAHVTALAVSEREKTAFLVYGEWNPLPEDDPQAQAEEDGLEDGEVRKLLVAFDACTFPLGAAKMSVGVGIDGVSYNTTSGHFDLPGPRVGFSSGAYNDLHDGLVYVPDQNEEVLYMVINDYGIAQYAEILPGAPREACAHPGPLPAVPVLGAPTASLLGSTTTTLVGSSLGVLAAAMVAYLLTVKRRAAQHATAEDRR